MPRLRDLEGGMGLRLDEALTIIEQKITAITQTIKISLDQAHHHILADDLYALSSSPPFDNAAVDGYAFSMPEKPEDELIFDCEDDVAAGNSKNAIAQSKYSAIRIFTGAPIPKNCDTVIMQEDTEILPDGSIKFGSGLIRGSNLRKTGEDIKKDTLILPAGTRVTPCHMALMASCGISMIKAARPLKVALLSTGTELNEPGENLTAAGLYDSNRIMLKSFLKSLGCEIIDLGIIKDDLVVLRKTLKKAASCDLLISSGGMSEGREDHMRQLLHQEGSLFFHNLAIRPGRPVGVGYWHDGKKPLLIAGLPGNPVAVFTVFCLIIRPLLAKLAKETYPPPTRQLVRADFTMKMRKGRRDFMRGITIMQKNDLPLAKKYGKSGAAILSSLIGAQGFLDIDERIEKIEKGDIINFIPFPEMIR